MKLKVIGCYCTWFKELSTSFLIDETMLFDVPQGSFKTLLSENNLLNIEYIIISHFHSDHFGDLHAVIDYLNQHKVEKNIKILAPKGCKERLKNLLKILDVSHLDTFIDEHLTFIDCENNKIVKMGDYKIKCYKMLHQTLDAYGFTIEKDGAKVGFTGDSAMCNNVRKIIAHSNAIFIDTASMYEGNKHLSVSEVLSLAKEFENCKFIPIHLTYKTRDFVKDTLEIPSQGQEYIFS